MVSSWQHLLWSFCIHCWLCVTMTLTTEDWTESSEATMCKGNNNASVRVSQHIYIGLIGQNARWHLWIEITQKKVVLNPYSENTCMCLRVYIKVSTDTVCESWTGVCEWPRNNGLNYWITGLVQITAQCEHFFIHFTELTGTKLLCTHWQAPINIG